MDASLALTGLIEELNVLIEGRDFEGAEEFLSRSLVEGSKYEAFLHFQMGRMYIQWNKLSSAVNHLTRSAELAHLQKDEILMIQAREELKAAKALQLHQRP